MSANRQLLVDTVAVRFLINESKERNGRLVLRGEFANGGKKTANNRLYPRSLWEKVIEKNIKNIKARKVTGELDHPEDGKLSLSRASHIITNLWLDGEKVLGELEVLNTSKGRDLRELIESNAAVGVSSRGLGSVSEDSSGSPVVNDDYHWQTFDVVADPAIDTAYPEAVQESTVIQGEGTYMSETTTSETPEGTQTEEEKAAKEAEAKASAGTDQTTDQKVEVPPPAATEPAAEQPSTQDSSTTSTQASEMKKYMKNAEEASRLKTENAKLSTVVKDVSFKFFIERSLRGHPDIDGVIKEFDASKHESLETVKTWLKPYVEERASLRAASLVQAESRTAALENRMAESLQKESRAVARAESLSEQVEDLKKKFADAQKLAESRGKELESSRKELTASLSEQSALSAKLYVFERLKGNAKALDSGLSLLENWKDTSPAGLKKLCEQVDVPTKGVNIPAHAGVRSNLHRMPDNAVETAVRNTAPERQVKESKDEVIELSNGMAINLDESRKLAGLS